MNLGEYYCRLIIECYAHDFHDSVLLMSEHFTKDAHHKTLFRPNDPWTTNDKDTKPYIFEHLDNIILFRSQYITTSINNNGPFIDEMFSPKNFAHTFCRHFINVINSNPQEHKQDLLMAQYTNSFWIDTVKQCF